MDGLNTVMFFFFVHLKQFDIITVTSLLPDVTPVDFLRCRRLGGIGLVVHVVCALASIMGHSLLVLSGSVQRFDDLKTRLSVESVYVQIFSRLWALA